MADQPAPQPPGRRPSRRLVIAVVLAVLVLAGVITGVVLGTSSPSRHPAALPVSTPPPTIAASSSATPTPSASPSPSATPTSARPSAPHEVVASSAPTEFEIKGPAFDIRANVCGMLNIRPLDPPGEQHHTVCWVKEGFGVPPGSTSGTTYILGHAWGQDDLEVLNGLSSTAMKQVLTATPVQVSGVDTYPVTAMDGYTLTLRTGSGVLTYTVRDAYAVSKNQAGYVQPLMNQTIPNRVVIITCGELNHRDYDYNIIVDAYLAGSVSAQHA